MNEEKQTRTSRPKPPIGSIAPPQYQVFGNSNGEDTGDDNIKRSEVQVSKSPAVQTVEPLEAQTSKSLEVQQSTIPEVQVSSSPNIKKSKHPEWKQQTVYLPPAIAKWLKVHAAEAELEISEIVSLALQEYRERHKP